MSPRQTPKPGSKQTSKPRNPTGRFSDRVEFYIRYRPRYPRELVQHLADEAGLKPGHIVADMGCGTGFLAEVFLQHGCTVIGIEPNPNMREAALALLAGYERFRCESTKAEACGLPDASVDWVTAGQAFHWFDAEVCGAEFRRVLRPGGQAALAWNDRDEEGTAFMREYDGLLQTYAEEYKAVGHRNIEAEVFERFFGGPYRTANFPTAQSFDREALRGRLLSSSYAPAEGAPGHAPMIAALDDLFERHAEPGPEGEPAVAFLYNTRLFWGALA